MSAAVAALRLRAARSQADKGKRRLSCPTHVGSPETSTAKRALNFQDPGRFFSRRPQAERRNEYWQPGETLPIPARHPDPVRVSGEQSQAIVETLHMFQSSMDRQFSSVSEKLETIDSRMVVLETRQKNLEEEMRSSPSCSSSNNSTPSLGRQRKRVTPLALQSKIRKVNNSFDEDKQLKPQEAINAAGNRQAVEEIIKCIGTEQYTEEQIRKACQTYRRTIVAREKAIGTPIKKKKRLRSRKQRCYERRGKEVVGSKEAKRWCEVTPSMMSDEEEQGDIYIRRPPQYRSNLLAQFIEKLESRYEKRNSATSHPRKKRIVGSPIDVPTPVEAKKWMLKPGIISDTVAPSSENEVEHNAQTETDAWTMNHELLQDNERDQDSESGLDTENEGSDELFSD